MYIAALIAALATSLTIAAGGSAGTATATSARGAVWSPDSTALAFTETTGDGRSDIYRVNVDGSGLTNLTADDSTQQLHGSELAPHGNPAWSRNGRIAYTVNRGDLNDRAVEYWVMQANGGDKHRAASEATEQSPSWSPDDAALTMADFESVVVVRIQSGVQTTVKVGAGNSIWSPRDRRIALSATAPRDSNNVDVYTAWPDGSHPRRLTTARGSDWPVAWSPDARRIVFATQRLIVASPRRNRLPALYVMDANGRHQHRVGTGSSADFSPAGTRVLYSDGTSLYIVNTDGTHRRLLEPSGTDPKWSPNGRWISFTSDNTIEIVHPDGTGLQTIAP